MPLVAQTANKGAPPSAPACSRRARDGCRRETIGMVKGGDGGQRPTQQRVGSLPYPNNKRPSGQRRPGTHPGPWNQLPDPHVGVSPDPWLGGSSLRFTKVDGSNFPPPGGGTSGHDGGTGGGYSLGGCSNLCSGSRLLQPSRNTVIAQSATLPQPWNFHFC